MPSLSADSRSGGVGSTCCSPQEASVSYRRQLRLMSANTGTRRPQEYTDLTGFTANLTAWAVDLEERLEAAESRISQLLEDAEFIEEFKEVLKYSCQLNAGAARPVSPPSGPRPQSARPAGRVRRLPAAPAAWQETNQTEQPTPAHAQDCSAVEMPPAELEERVAKLEAAGLQEALQAVSHEMEMLARSSQGLLAVAREEQQAAMSEQLHELRQGAQLFADRQAAMHAQLQQLGHQSSSMAPFAEQLQQLSQSTLDIHEQQAATAERTAQLECLKERLPVIAERQACMDEQLQELKLSMDSTKKPEQVSTVDLDEVRHKTQSLDEQQMLLASQLQQLSQNIHGLQQRHATSAEQVVCDQSTIASQLQEFGRHLLGLVGDMEVHAARTDDRLNSLEACWERQRRAEEGTEVFRNAVAAC
eukprot:TRINITY_DN7906_c0_g1_i1.p1 TRINITY_DN7906_c0_g1~~TRINITY_DN7906_c0_g1_i1.p1  ORF type:complete len:418 (-),score=141.68 TRINITY_DN7906_c0_g1_i1:79-1332(-)